MVIKLTAVKRTPQSIFEDRQEYTISSDNKEQAKEMAIKLAQRGYTVISEEVDLDIPSGTTTH